MSVRVSIEGARGCGYRKEGGLYLVSGQLSEPCPLLPFETSVCPTCGEGIKPARGFTWVDGQKFIPPSVHGTDEHDLVCPLSPARDEMGGYEYLRVDGEWKGDKGHTPTYVSRVGRCGLIWVGVQHYKTPQDFMREAASMGVSRRIAAVPKDFVVGETWVLLGHAKAIAKPCSECGDLPERRHEVPGSEIGAVLTLGPDPECPVCEGTGFEMRPGIITAFRPTAVEYVVKPEEEEDEEFLAGLEKRGITPVKVVKDTDQQALGV